MHHAQYLIGPRSLREDVMILLEKELNIAPQANPDFFDRTYETFAIDDARELKSFNETRPMQESGKKISVISMNGITVEAQNALLKLFEEPAEYAHFFLVIPSAHLLLPTVKSRMQEYRPESSRGKTGNSGDAAQEEKSEDMKKNAQRFLEVSPSKRLEMIKNIIDSIGKEKMTKQDAIEFLNSVERGLYENGGVKQNAKSLQAVDIARKYINDRAPSVKMLLEFVALSL